RQIKEDSLEKLNAPYYEQIKQLNKLPQNGENIQQKKQLLQKVYANKFSINKNLASIDNGISHEWSDGLTELAPTIAKFEDFSRKISNNESIGVELLRKYLKRLEMNTFLHNIGSYEESSTSDVYRYTSPGDFNVSPSDLKN